MLLIIIQLQNLTTTEETLGLRPFADKWKAFGWDVREVDGHDYEAILDSPKKSSDKPICLIGHTTKEKAYLSWKIQFFGTIDLLKERNLLKQ